MSGVLQFLSPLVHPIGLGWLVLLVATGVALYRRHRVTAAGCGVSALLLWSLAQAPLVGPLYRQLEAPWIGQTADHAPAADAVVVLGGGWRPSRVEYRHVDFTDAGDRFLVGVELCRLGRAPILVLGGDPARRDPGLPPDSEQLARWARDWGLSGTEIVSLGPVRTTRDEAVSAGELVRKRGWRKVLLVTSAFHMRRAVATFERAGVPVQPVACDFRYIRGDRDHARWQLFPNDEAVFSFGIWWHEQLGWLAYRILGQL